MTNAPASTGAVVQVAALLHMAAFESAFVREPEDWGGAYGHPLRAVDSLACHLFGRYPTPRFLASTWFDNRVDRRSWFVAHARGQRFRSLSLPLAMARRMEDIFLHTPDHIAIDHAFRRAEVLGLGGSLELVDAVIATRLGTCFDDADQWRVALAWLARCSGSLDLVHVSPLIDFLHANLRSIDLRGRTFESAMRLVRDWHGALARAHMRSMSWSRSRWQPMQVVETEPRPAEWSLVELLDSHELFREGRAMRHCVSTYAHACVTRHSSIWSLRHRWNDDDVARSVLTIEVSPSSGKIVQVRAKANGRASGWPLQLVHRWAARERLLL